MCEVTNAVDWGRRLDVKLEDQENAPDGVVMSRGMEYTDRNKEPGVSHYFEIISLELSTQPVAVVNAYSQFGTITHVKMGANYAPWLWLLLHLRIWPPFSI